MTRILVVEDDPAARETLDVLLSDEYDVVGVAGTRPAIASLAAEGFDIVISDFHLQGEDGASLFPQVRERWPETMFLLLTGDPTQAASAVARLGGDVRIVAKPCEPNVLLRCVTLASTFASLRRSTARLPAVKERSSPKTDSCDSERVLWVIVLEHEKHLRQAQASKLEAASAAGLPWVNTVDARDAESCLRQVIGIRPDALIADPRVLSPTTATWMARLRALPAGKALPAIFTRRPRDESVLADARCSSVSGPASLEALAAALAHD